MEEVMLQYILAQNFCDEILPIGGGVWFANIKSAKKRVLVNQTKAARNKAAKSTLKTQLKYFDAAIIEGNRSGADKRYKEAVKAVDQAAARGLMHKEHRSQPQKQDDSAPEQRSLSNFIARTQTKPFGFGQAVFAPFFWESRGYPTLPPGAALSVSFLPAPRRRGPSRKKLYNAQGILFSSA